MSKILLVEQDGDGGVICVETTIALASEQDFDLNKFVEVGNNIFLVDECPIDLLGDFYEEKEIVEITEDNYETLVLPYLEPTEKKREIFQEFEDFSQMIYW